MNANDVIPMSYIKVHKDISIDVPAGMTLQHWKNVVETNTKFHSWFRNTKLFLKYFPFVSTINAMKVARLDETNRIVDIYVN
jgi:hypothetical protein